MSLLERVVHARTVLPLALGVAAVVTPLRSEAQQETTETAFLRAAADHFRMPADEARILARWGLATDEIPVVLHVARRGGISPDAIVSLRRGGASWHDIGTRYGISAATLHVPFGAGAPPGGALARAYGLFEETPRSRWDRIRLTDAEVVALVNVRFLSEELGVAPAAVLAAAGGATGFAGAYGRLAGGRG